VKTVGPDPSLRKRALSASAVWVGAYVPLQVIRVGSQVWLAALLDPMMFGLVRLAYVVVQGLKMFSEVGIRHAIVRSERGDDPDFLNTAWTMQVGRGALLWVVATLLAFPAAAFYEEKTLLYLLPGIATVSLIGGFASTRFVQLNRALREGPRAMLEVSQAVVTRGTMIAWALICPNVWALVAGPIAGVIFFVSVSHALLPGVRNRFRWDRAAVGELWSFGSWIFVGTVIAYFGQQFDSLMLGKLEAIRLLGVYAIALTISRLPLEITNIVSAHVLFPVMSELARENAEQFGHRVRRIRAALLPASATIILCVATGAPWFFRWFYDARYADAIWMTPLACVGVWVSVLSASAGRALLSLGRTRALACSGLVRVLVTAASCLAGYHSFGLPGLILGVGIGLLAGHLVDLMMLARQGTFLFSQDLWHTVVLVMLAGACVAAYKFGDRLADPVLSPVAALGLSSVVCAVAGLWVLRVSLPILRGK